MPTSKIGLHDLDPSLFETLSNISGSNSQTKIFPLQVVASEDNQIIFPIGLDTFDAEKDFAFVQSGVTNLFYGADFTIENKNIVLKEGVPAGRTLGIYVLKNVAQTDEEDYVSGANLAPSSVTPDKIGGVLPIEKGGTGATTVEEALTNLEAVSNKDFVVIDERMKSVQTKNEDVQYRFQFSSAYRDNPYLIELFKSLDNGVTWQHETSLDLKKVFTTEGGQLNNDLGIKDNEDGFAGISFGGSIEGKEAKIGYNREWDCFSTRAIKDNTFSELLISALNDLPRKVQLNVNDANWYNIFGEHNTELLVPVIQSIIQGGNVSMVKSVQRGIISISNNYTGTATINSVNTAKSIVIYGGVRVTSGYNGTMHSEEVSQFTGNLVLTNSTTVTATLGDYASSAKIPFQVIEYY